MDNSQDWFNQLNSETTQKSLSENEQVKRFLTGDINAVRTVTPPRFKQYDQMLKDLMVNHPEDAIEITKSVPEENMVVFSLRKDLDGEPLTKEECIDRAVDGGEINLMVKHY